MSVCVVCVDTTLEVDSGNKIEISSVIKDMFVAQLPAWWTMPTVHCVVAGNVYIPDLGSWTNKPTLPQRSKPVENQCPAPDVWFEVRHKQVACLVLIVFLNTGCQ
jgi:hypothetical protein